MKWFQRTPVADRRPSARRDGQGGALSQGPDVESATLRIGRELLEAARREGRGLVERFWRDPMLDWAMRDPGFKTQLFRFIDVLPMLRSPEQVHEVLVEYLGQPGVALPPGVGLGLKLGGLAKGLFARTLAGQVQSLAERFIAGPDVAAALPKLRRLWQEGIAFTADLLGEACVSRAEADAYRERYLDLMNTLADAAADWPADPLLESDHLGRVPRVNVSLKLSALDARPDPADFRAARDRIAAAIRPILEAAGRRGVFVNFDMEQAAIKDLTLAVFRRSCEEVDFPAGIAMQTYLRSGDDDVAELIAWARKAGRRVTVRLIKGAYWDYEMAAALVAAMPHGADEPGVLLAVGSHNARSIARVLALLDERDLPPTAAEFQMLFGMADQRERFAAAVRSARVPQVAAVTSVAAVHEAVARAEAAFPAWRDRDPLDRAACLVAAAGRMRSRRDELAGMVVAEAGKTWREADADVCEAVDFLEFYAREAPAFFQPRRLGRVVAEHNHVWHEPRGAAAVISPWNFPLAIAAGMSSAALVTGNTVILKPSGLTPGIGRVLCELLWESGVPADVLQFLPGPGEVVGAALVDAPRVALIAFTGSREVGLELIRRAATPGEDPRHVKKAVCEMGGKNAIIVDDSADLDEAVLGVRQSAFGYSGQKCSACSRAIVVEGVYHVFLKRLVESTASLVIGDPADPGTDVGPVIDRRAAEKIAAYIDLGKQEGRLELACPVPPGLEERVGRPFVGPHIFSGIRPEHRLANEEVFGPVLAVLRAAHFREALDMANAARYKLTGGVYSRRPSHLMKARREFRVGNLYLNRAITGALVGRQPFGGFGLSGAGTQAGGAEYLGHFVEPRACAENTLRHGFAPEEA